MKIGQQNYFIRKYFTSIIIDKEHKDVHGANFC